MFSPNIQNLIKSSGQEVAAQRAVQLNKYVDTFYKTQNPFELPSQKTVTSFSDVLKSSTNAEGAYKVSNTPFGMGVKGANVISNTANQSLNPLTATKSQILNIVSSIAKKYEVDENLVKAVIKQESGFKSDAVSKAGAMGLMQLMPATARGLGVSDPLNPIQNVDGGVRYLKQMLSKYNGNVILALAAYNAGSGAVDKYNGVPPYAETQNYVKSILANYLG